MSSDTSTMCSYDSNWSDCDGPQRAYDERDHTFAICAYGESPFLEECIRSLIDQDARTKLQISTSTPNPFIKNLAASYDIELFINEGGPGIAHDWNCALANCHTPLVTVAHQDDIYLPSYTRTMLACINEEPHPLIFFSNYGELRGNDKCNRNGLLNTKRVMLSPLKIPALRKNRFVRRRMLSFGSPICCPSVTYCMPNLFVPLFLDSMKCDLDWQTWERISRLAGSFVYSDKLLMRHRIHGGSETTSLIQDSTRTKEDLEMFELFWPHPIARLVNRLYTRSQSSNYVQ